jgi:hypothetical protein
MATVSPLTPSEVRKLKEDAFKKYSRKFREQAMKLPEKIDKVLKSKIKEGKKDPYTFQIAAKKGSIDKSDVVRILLEFLSSLEKSWYISIKVTNIVEIKREINIYKVFQEPDCGIILIISENPINIPSIHYHTHKTDHECNCKNDCNRRCSICDINHIRCVVYPCGHANYCWECARKINNCGVCRILITERKGVIV